MTAQLTDEQIEQLWQTAFENNTPNDFRIAFARTIIAADRAQREQEQPAHMEAEIQELLLHRRDGDSNFELRLRRILGVPGS